MQFIVRFPMIPPYTYSYIQVLPWLCSIKKNWGFQNFNKKSLRFSEFNKKNLRFSEFSKNRFENFIDLNYTNYTQKIAKSIKSIVWWTDQYWDLSISVRVWPLSSHDLPSNLEESRYHFQQRHLFWPESRAVDFGHISTQKAELRKPG